MSYIILYTTNDSVAKTLYNLEHGRKDTRQKPLKNFFVLNISNDFSRRSVTKVMRNNGWVLSYIANLLNRYPNEVYVWVADRITLNQFPELCKKGGLWLSERSGRSLKYLPKYLDVTKEVLEKCKINYSLNLKE